MAFLEKTEYFALLKIDAENAESARELAEEITYSFWFANIEDVYSETIIWDAPDGN